MNATCSAPPFATPQPWFARLRRHALLLTSTLALALTPLLADAQSTRKGKRASNAADDPRELMHPQIRETRTPIATDDASAAASPAETSRWRLQRRMELELDQQRNYRLDRRNPERRTDVEPLLRLGATWQGSEHLIGFLETEMLIRQRDERGEPSQTDGRLRINQAYFALDNWIDNTELRLGRFLYRDEREWLFDESIDGVYASHDFGKIEVDAMTGRVNHFRRDLFDSSTRGDPINIIGLVARAEVRRRFEVGAYLVVSHDTSGGAGQQRHFGLRAHGKLGSWQHWTELAFVQGHIGEKRISGQAVDIGGYYLFAELPLKPRLLLGYAWGSGDDKPDDNTERRYRQTGLQGNEARLGGLYKRRIYGEVMNPELSNLHVLNAGIGISPAPQWSLDLLWFGYAQDKIGPVEHASVRGRRDSLEGRRLGNELNLVLGYAPTDAIIVGAILGWHQPSDRFDRDASGRERDPGVATYGGLELRVRF